jgi:hypothetical protein
MYTVLIKDPLFGVLDVDCAMPLPAIRLCADTKVNLLCDKLKVVFILDMAPSMSTVDNSEKSRVLLGTDD